MRSGQKAASSTRCASAGPRTVSSAVRELSSSFKDTWRLRPVRLQGHRGPAAGGGSVAGGEKADAAVLQGVLDREVGLVGVLAEVDLEGVRARGEHVDVGAGAEDAVMRAGDHAALHCRVL